MKIRILGCGGSFGSPLAWNKNGNIDVNNGVIDIEMSNESPVSGFQFELLGHRN